MAPSLATDQQEPRTPQRRPLAGTVLITQNMKLKSGSGPLTGPAVRLSTTVGAPSESAGENCQHSKIQVDSQAVRTRPSQGSDPSAMELTLTFKT